MLTREQMQNNLIERLFWHTSERDESKVAHHLFCRKEMDTVYTLDEATLFDFFFHYLREIEVFPLLASRRLSNGVYFHRITNFVFIHPRLRAHESEFRFPRHCLGSPLRW